MEESKINEIIDMLKAGKSYTTIQAKIEGVYPAQISLIKKKYLNKSTTTKERTYYGSIRIAYAWKVQKHLQSLGLKTSIKELKAMKTGDTLQKGRVKIKRVKAQTWKIW